MYYEWRDRVIDIGYGVYAAISMQTARSREMMHITELFILLLLHYIHNTGINCDHGVFCIYRLILYISTYEYKQDCSLGINIKQSFFYLNGKF